MCAYIYSANYIFAFFPGVMELNRCNFFINLTKEGEAVIRSPGFPFRYGQGLNCTWTIDAGTSNFVKLEIVFLNLAKSTTEIELKEVITNWTKLIMMK